MISWAEFTFPAVNLWNLPKQNKDFMNHIAERRKANRMKLKPVKRPSAASQITVEPASGEVANYEFARAIHCQQFGGFKR